MRRLIAEMLTFGLAAAMILGIFVVAFVLYVVSDMQQNFHGPSDPPTPLDQPVDPYGPMIVAPEPARPPYSDGSDG